MSTHHPAPHDPAGDRGSTRRLAWVLALTVAYTAAEVVGGLISNSLALLADAGHMMTDNLALGLALAAAWFARRPPDLARTFGYRRAEILAALANGVFLVVICLYLFWEAWHRFRDQPEVDFRIMGAVAVGGLIVNIVAAAILHGHQHGLNVRGAYLHVLGDLLGSIGALTAALLMALFDWRWADPLATVLIAGIIIVSSTRLVLQAVHVLMEGAPPDLDCERLLRDLAAQPGVVGVHDLHVWTLGGGTPLLSAHLVVDHDCDATGTLRATRALLARRYGITHSTVQVEPPDFDIISDLGRGD